MQRMTASSGSRTVLLPQTGQVSGIWYGTGFSPWRTTFKTSGIISPAFRTSRVSPIQISFSVIKSWLCRVARLTEVPARVTLSKTAVGGQGAGAADLDFNIPQDRFFFFRWVFEGHRPAGELDGRADLLPEGEVVDFDNSTVDIKVVLPSSGVD